MRVFKKLKQLAFFLAGVVIVFALILTRHHFQIFQTLAAQGNSNLIVYDDQLASGFSNWSWGSSVDLSNTTSVSSGTNAIRFTPSAWGGLYFHSANSIDPTQYATFQFAMQTTDTPNNFTVIFYGANNQVSKSFPLSQFTGNNQNGWTIYTLPVTSVPAPITGVALQESSGKSGPNVYVDNVQFVANQPTQQSASSSSSQTYNIYTDSPASGWINWSWNSTINLTNSSPVYQGSNAISFTPTSGYGGLYLHTESGVDTTPYTALTFAIKASTAGQAVGVGLYDNNNTMLHSVSLDNYGGQPDTSDWKVYTVPLNDLNANGKTIKGVMIQDITGHAQQILYVDQISLVSSGSKIQAAAMIPASSVSIAPTTAPVAQTPVQSVAGNPISGMTLFNDTAGDPATQQEQQWRSSNPTDATTIAKIASQPKAIWIGSWNTNVQSDVQSAMSRAQSANALPVFVAYNIPQRDCGSYSAGGASSAQAYQSWIDGFANGIGKGRAAVILEPDALAQITCLSQSDQQQRLSLLSYAVQKFKSLGSTAVYLDAGNSNWIDGNTMAGLLKSAGIAQADGFALNVSNFYTNSASISYGQQVSSLVQNKHFVIDTSRSGNGPASDSAWCNPAGRALGDKPTTQTGNPLVDAYLWIKYPGESDGSCNGAPAAGAWYPSYALSLAQNAKW